MPSTARPSPCQALSGSGPADPTDIASVRVIEGETFPRWTRQACSGLLVTEADEGIDGEYEGTFPDSSSTVKRDAFLIRLVGAARERFAEAGEFLTLLTRPTVFVWRDDTGSMTDFWGEEGPVADQADCKIEALRRELVPLGIQTLVSPKSVEDNWGEGFTHPVFFNKPANDALTAKFFGGAVWFLIFSDEAVQFSVDVPNTHYHEPLYDDTGSGDRPRHFNHRTTSQLWKGEENIFQVGTTIRTGPVLDEDGDPIPGTDLPDPARPKYEIVGGLVLQVAVYEQFFSHRTNPIFVPIVEANVHHERDLRFKPFQPIFGQFIRKALKRLDQYAGLPPAAEYVPTGPLFEDNYDWPDGPDASTDDEDGAREELGGANTFTLNKTSTAPLAEMGFFYILGYERYDLTIQETGLPYDVDLDVRFDTFGVQVDHIVFRATQFFHLLYPDIPVSGAEFPIVK